MSPRQTFVGWTAVVAASVLLCYSFSAGQEPRGRARSRVANAANQAPAAGAPAAAAASDPAKLLPADPVLYVGWDGEAKHRAAWEKTAAFASLHKSGLAEVATKMFANLTPEQAGEQAAFINALSEAVRQNGVSLAVTVPAAEGAPLPWGVLVLHGGAKLEPQIAAAIQGLLQGGPVIELQTEDRNGRTVNVLRSPQFPPAEGAWWTEGEHLVFAVGVGAVNNALAVAEGNAGDLTTSRLWKSYREGKQPFEVASLAWLDVAKLAKSAGPIPVPVRGPNQPPATIAEIIKAVGLEGLNAYVFRSGFQGQTTVSEVRVETSKERSGLLGLAYPQPITLADLPPLPAKSGGFRVSSFDAAAAFDAVIGAARNFMKLRPQEAQQQFEQALEQGRSAIGLNVKADLLEPLGNVYCLYNDSAQGPLGLGLTLAVSVDDAAKLRGSLDQVLERVGGQIPETAFNVRRTKKHGEDVVTLEIAGAVANPSFVLTDDWLVVSIVPQACETFLLRTAGKLPAWKPEGPIAETLKTTPKQFTALAISDPRDTYRLIGGLAPVVLPIARRLAADAAAREGRQISFDVAVADLPPAEIIAEPLFPNVSVTYTDGDTVVQHTRSSLPGFPFGDNASVGVATTAVAVALLLPAVQSAREAARRTQSKNNLKQIGLALHNYHDTFNGFPAGTIEASADEPEDRLSWMASVLPFIEQQNIYNQLDQSTPWDEGANGQAADFRVPVYMNPAIGNDDPNEPAPTHYVGLAGVGEDGPELDVNDPKAGVFGYNRAARLGNIADGTSNTVMVSEATEDSAGPWAQGGPSTIRPLTEQPYINGPDGIGGPYAGGCHMLLGDGSVRFVSENIDPAVMEALVTINGGEVIGDF